MVLVRFFGGEVVARLGAVRTCADFRRLRVGGDFDRGLGGLGVDGLRRVRAFPELGLRWFFPLAFSRAANEPGQSAGAAIAGVATFGYGGLLLGPPIIGFVAERTSLESGFLVLAVLSVVIVAFAGTFRPAPISESEAENVIQ